MNPVPTTDSVEVVEACIAHDLAYAHVGGQNLQKAGNLDGFLDAYGKLLQGLVQARKKAAETKE